MLRQYIAIKLAVTMAIPIQMNLKTGRESFSLA